MKNAARGDCNFRVRRWTFPRATIGIAARGVLFVSPAGAWIYFLRTFLSFVTTMPL